MDLDNPQSAGHAGSPAWRRTFRCCRRDGQRARPTERTDGGAPLRALALLTLLTAVACAPDVAVAPADTAAADAADDLDAALAAGSDAQAELPPDVAVPADVAPDVPAPPDVAPDAVAPDVVVVDPCAGKTCDDGNACTSDSCSGGACVYLPTTATCSDGNACTLGDTCKGGLCLPGAVTDCSDGLACTVDNCAPVVGCASVVSATCDDGNPCTLDGCGTTGCTHDGEPTGCDDGNPCTSDTCAGGACLHGYVDGPACCTSDVDALGKCDDANPCTIDYCQFQQCKHEIKGCGGDCCVTDADCPSDGDKCTQDFCDTAVPIGDHFACKHVLADPTCISCTAQSVVAGVDCNDQILMSTDYCDAAGHCAHAFIANGCADKFDCDDGNDCTGEVCSCATDCTNPSLAAGWPCGTGGTCDGKGSCVLNAPVGMVLIPAGTFWMGCNGFKDANCNNNEKPQHKVTLSAYYMDVTETTWANILACVNAGGCPESWAYVMGSKIPVYNITWDQARQYCQWRGASFDLPTEAQWEMAARGSCEKNGSTSSAPTCAAAMRTYPWGETTPNCS